MQTIFIDFKKKNKSKTINLIKKEVKIPKPHSNEVLIKTLACGVCSTDIKKIIRSSNTLIEAKQLNRNSRKDYLGHEVFGEIINVGSKINKNLVGKKVIVADINSCKSFNISPECENCKKKQGIFCLNKRKRKNTRDVYGGYSDYFIRSIHQCLVLKSSINKFDAIFTEPLASAVNCERHIDKNSKILIYGYSTISILLFRYLKYLNYKKENIYFYIKNKEELNHLKKNTKCNYLLTLRDKQNFFDNIIDFIGNGEEIDKYLNILNLKGNILLFGLENMITKFNSSLLINKQISINGIHGYSSKFSKGKFISDIEKASKLLAQKKIRVDDLISKKLNFKNAHNELEKICYLYKKNKKKNKLIFRTVFYS